MARPLVSVIIPVYNGGRFLRATMESVLSQTYSPLEIICVDDGSTDGSAHILRDFAHIATVLQQRHSGQATARNWAVEKSHGQWLAFLDQDDLWDRDKLEVQMSHVGADDDIIHSSARVVDAAGAVIKGSMRRPPVEICDSLAAYLESLPVCMCTAVVRREALLSVGGFDPANRFGTDDCQLWLTLAATRHKFRYIDKILASYRVHPGAASSNIMRMVEGALYAYEKIQSGYPKLFDRKTLSVLMRRKQRLYFEAGWSYYDKTDYARAAELFLLSAKCDKRKMMPWLYSAVTRIPFRQTVIPLFRRLGCHRRYRQNTRYSDRL